MADIAFERIRLEAQSYSEAIARQFLPYGNRVGDEWVAKNPKRHDRRPGSFKINLVSGRWADFATGDAGGDLISLAAYLFDLDQGTAARRLAHMLGVNPEDSGT